ncbi:MAG TPA: TetR/AcrR family transcriptional regulator C-terminal domain-containing protein [Streptosporangiaceae bacterium]|nr:TetR/AcrR family transcriptional regulator C-terminal domain-containing protein [Streptosporangiaceae bacterium]
MRARTDQKMPTEDSGSAYSGSAYSGSGDPRRTIELLWGVERRRRGPRPSLSGEQIVTSAIGLADRDGLGGLSMRRLAEELGITAMSLYGYVPSKAELLDVMADRAYGEITVTGSPGSPWRIRLAELARQHFALLLAHPWLLQISASRPLLGPNLTALYDAELAAVDGLGLTDIDMDLVVSLLDDYVRGAARGSAEAAEAQARTGITDQQWWETYGPLLAEVLDPARYPTAVRVGSAAGAEYGAAHDPARSFGFGLQRLIDGIETFITTKSG